MRPGAWWQAGAAPGERMKQPFSILAVVAVAAAGLYLALSTQHAAVDANLPVKRDPTSVPGAVTADELLPEQAVLDISVHTLDELRVLLDRAEQLSNRLLDQGRTGASVVLVLHGPEVEFFSTKNYARYRDIVDQAARLDAFDIVDVKICQGMMNVRGVARDDIPAFIDQVPDGGAEIERLQREGYVYF